MRYADLTWDHPHIGETVATAFVTAGQTLAITL